MAGNFLLTPEQQARLADIQRLAELEEATLRPDIVPGSGAHFYFQLLKAVAQLARARRDAGLTLDQLAERTGLAVNDLARLEEGHFPNPTWGLLGRYAVAVGRTLQLGVGEPTPAAATPEPAGHR